MNDQPSRGFQALGCALEIVAMIAVLSLLLLMWNEAQAQHRVVVAQSVERSAEAGQVGGSIPSRDTISLLEGEISALIAGRATWYCGQGSPCTRGIQPGDLAAAIDPTTGIRKGDRVTVHHAGRSVTVRIVDVCACGGSRVIDLTTGAFRRLAPLSRGVIAVELEVGGRPEPTLPPTDTAP